MYIIKQHAYHLYTKYMTYPCFLSPYAHLSLSLSIHMYGISTFEYIEKLYEYRQKYTDIFA